MNYFKNPVNAFVKVFFQFMLPNANNFPSHFI